MNLDTLPSPRMLFPELVHIVVLLGRDSAHQVKSKSFFL